MAKTLILDPSGLPRYLGTKEDDAILLRPSQLFGIPPFQVWLLDGDDFLQGSIDNEYIAGNNGQDLIYGNDGNDTISGGKQNDEIRGDQGRDLLQGDDGNDTISGSDGDDTIYGGKANDELLGNDGNDFLQGDLGIDLLTGGNGQDTFALLLTEARGSIDTADIITDFNTSEDIIAIGGSLDLIDPNFFRVSSLDYNNDGLNDFLITLTNGLILAIVLNNPKIDRTLGLRPNFVELP